MFLEQVELNGKLVNRFNIVDDDI
ncbi:MAG: hypothetical protein KGZ63_12545 [Clostridiales bacterium]|nr:hypothetical protein [Clostridiales bacterium]